MAGNYPKASFTILRLVNRCEPMNRYEPPRIASSTRAYLLVYCKVSLCRRSTCRRRRPVVEFFPIQKCRQASTSSTIVRYTEASFYKAHEVRTSQSQSPLWNFATDLSPMGPGNLGCSTRAEHCIRDPGHRPGWSSLVAHSMDLSILRSVSGQMLTCGCILNGAKDPA